MKTYLKNWIPVKETENPTQINIYSSWALSDKDIKLRRILDDEANDEVMVEYDIYDGLFSGPKNLKAVVHLQIPWSSVSANHKIMIKGFYEGASSDEEIMDTANAHQH